MRNKIIAAAALAAGLLVSNIASAAEFNFYYLGELTTGQSAFIKSFGTKSAAKAAQDEIKSNPAVVASMHAQGVVLKNVILAKSALNGARIYYVK
jgi:hypothetical protein